MQEEREKERVASQKRRMPIIGNGRPHLATFALLDAVDTGLTNRPPVNHHRFTLTFYRSHACSRIYYTVADRWFSCGPTIGPRNTHDLINPIQHMYIRRMIYGLSGKKVFFQIDWLFSIVDFGLICSEMRNVKMCFEILFNFSVLILSWSLYKI